VRIFYNIVALLYLPNFKILIIIVVHTKILLLNSIYMNEFNPNPQSTPTQIGNEKPFPSSETIISNPELLGNENVESDHVLTLEPGHEVSDMVEEAKALAETAPENDLEQPQVELPEEVVSEVSAPEVNAPIIFEKKSNKKLFMGMAAGLTMLLGGLGINGMFSGKKPEMGMTDQAPKVEQANTTTTENTLKVPTIENTKAPVAEVPTVDNNEMAIQELMKEGRSREDSIMTLKNRAKYGSQGEMNDGAAMAEAETKEAQRLAEIKERNAKAFGTPSGWDQAAENKAQDEARATNTAEINNIGNQPADYSKLTSSPELQQSKSATMTIAMADGSKRQESIATVTSRRELTQSERDMLSQSRNGAQIVINNGKISVLIGELGGVDIVGKSFSNKIISIMDAKLNNSDYREVEVTAGKAFTAYDIDLVPMFGNQPREVRIGVSSPDRTDLAHLSVNKN
jgi:hypothetical protein